MTSIKKKVFILSMIALGLLTVNIGVLNVQSYPEIGEIGGWTVVANISVIGVKLNSTVIPDLEITGISNTTYSTIFDKDVEFEEVLCGDKAIQTKRSGNRYIATNYRCNNITYIRFTAWKGKHAVKIEYFPAVAYAFNDAKETPITSLVFNKKSVKRYNITSTVLWKNISIGDKWYAYPNLSNLSYKFTFSEVKEVLKVSVKPLGYNFTIPFKTNYKVSVVDNVVYLSDYNKTVWSTTKLIAWDSNKTSNGTQSRNNWYGDNVCNITYNSSRGILLYACNKSMIDKAVYPLYIDPTMLYYSDDVQSCWENCTCNYSVTNGTSATRDIMTYNESITPDMRALYKLNSGSGQWANDSVCINAVCLDGTLGADSSPAADDPLWVDGYAGTGLWGYEARYVNIVDNSNLSFTDEIFNISFRIKTTQAINASYEKFIVAKGWSGGQYEYAVRIDSGNNGNITCGVWTSNAGAYNGVVSTTQINDDVWHSVRCEGNGSYLSVWIDGTIEKSTPITVAMSDTNVNLTLFHAPGLIMQYGINATLDEVTITHGDRTVDKLYYTNGNITTTTVNESFTKANAWFDSLPSGTSFNMWYNGTGNWVSFCTSCSNGTNYSFTPQAGGQVRIELVSLYTNVTPQLNKFYVYGDAQTINITIYSPSNQTYNTANSTSFSTITGTPGNWSWGTAYYNSSTSLMYFNMSASSTNNLSCITYNLDGSNISLKANGTSELTFVTNNSNISSEHRVSVVWTGLGSFIQNWSAQENINGSIYDNNYTYFNQLGYMQEYITLNLSGNANKINRSDILQIKVFWSGLTTSSVFNFGALLVYNQSSGRFTDYYVDWTDNNVKINKSITLSSVDINYVMTEAGYLMFIVESGYASSTIYTDIIGVNLTVYSNATTTFTYNISLGTVSHTYNNITCWVNDSNSNVNVSQTFFTITKNSAVNSTVQSGTPDNWSWSNYSVGSGRKVKKYYTANYWEWVDE